LFGSQEDFRLVISNAKTFNPPGTIYHTEAERIEAWASDHISKASSCVIEYETEWNIDVDRDEDVNVDADEDAAGGAGSGPGRTGSVGPDTPARRSPSVLSASVPPTNRRGRNAAKKEGISETLDPDGHFPGFKDGVGVFPPGSDWAEVMLALKLKGAVTSFSSDRVLPFHDPNHTLFLLLQC
jgi:bromodomain-containing protein 7/9